MWSFLPGRLRIRVRLGKGLFYFYLFSLWFVVITGQHKIPKNLFGLLARQMNGVHQLLQFLCPSFPLRTCRVLRLQTPAPLDGLVEMLIEYSPLEESFPRLVGQCQDRVKFFQVVLDDRAGDENSHVSAIDEVRSFEDLGHAQQI